MLLLDISVHSELQSITHVYPINPTNSSNFRGYPLVDVPFAIIAFPDKIMIIHENLMIIC